MLEVVCGVDSCVGASIKVCVAHCASSKADLGNRLAWKVDAEQLKLTLYSTFEVKRFAIIRPFESAGNQIEPIRGKHRRLLTYGRRQPNLRVIAVMQFARESDVAAIGRPAWTTVSFLMIGNLCK